MSFSISSRQLSVNKVARTSSNVLDLNLAQFGRKELCGGVMQGTSLTSMFSLASRDCNDSVPIS